MILFEANSVYNPEIEAAKIFAGDKGAIMSASLPDNGAIWQDEGDRVSFFKPERVNEEDLCQDLMRMGSIEEINMRSCERFMNLLPYIKVEEGMAVFAVSGEKKGVPIGDFLEIYKDNYRQDEVKAVKTEEQKDKKEAGLAGLIIGGGAFIGMCLLLKNSISKASQRERSGNRINVEGSEFQDLLTKRAQKEDRRRKKEMIEEGLGIKKENKREEKIDYRTGRWSRAFSGGSEDFQDRVIEKQIKQLKNEGYKVYDARNGNEETVNEVVNLVAARETGRRLNGEKVAVVLDNKNMSDREKIGVNYVVLKGDLHGVQAGIKGFKSVKDVKKMERILGPEGIEIKGWKGREDGVSVYEIGNKNRH